MPSTVSFAPGAVTSPANIDLPTGSPLIDSVINATLFRGSDGTAAAAEIAAVPTRVDNNTITLSVNTETLDLLVIRYLEEGPNFPKP